MLRSLRFGLIAGGSPQAKGRIERLWRTLQDRLTVSRLSPTLGVQGPRSGTPQEAGAIRRAKVQSAPAEPSRISSTSSARRSPRNTVHCAKRTQRSAWQVRQTGRLPGQRQDESAAAGVTEA